MIYLGIDPGVNNGVAVYDSERRELDLSTLSFFSLINYLDYFMLNNYHVTAVIENVVKNKPIFSKRRTYQTRQDLKIAQNVGENKAYCKLIIAKCEKLGFRIILKTPGKNNSKLDSEQFQKITGINIKCSQHARDAFMLIFEYFNGSKIHPILHKLKNI